MDVVVASHILQGHDFSVHLDVLIARIDQRKPLIEEFIPGYSLESGVLFVSYEPEEKLGICRLSRGRYNSTDLHQSPQGTPFITFLVVFFREPVDQVFDHRSEVIWKGRSRTLACKGSREAPTLVTCPAAPASIPPKATGFSTVMTRSRSPTSLESSRSGTNTY